MVDSLEDWDKLVFDAMLANHPVDEPLPIALGHSKPSNTCSGTAPQDTNTCSTVGLSGTAESTSRAGADRDCEVEAI